MDQFKKDLVIDEGFSLGYLNFGYLYAGLGRILDAFSWVNVLEEKDPLPHHLPLLRPRFPRERHEFIQG